MVRSLTTIGVVGVLILLVGMGWAAARGPASPNAAPLLQTPAGTAFTYQGRLTDEFQQPITASRNFQFGLFIAATGGTALATDSASSVQVVSGLFTVMLNFQDNVFDGDMRFLEIEVECPPPQRV